MIIQKCDICGREIKSFEGSIEITQTDGRKSNRSNYDLCAKCANDVIPNIEGIINLAKKGVTFK